METSLQFVGHAGEFLAVAGEHLALDPVVNTVVATCAERTISAVAEGDAPAGLPATDADHAPRLLARVLHERGESLPAVNGALPAVREFADETARLTGCRVEVATRTRLFVLDQLVPPAPVPGRLRPATEDDLGLALEWFGAFMADADEQAAGRPSGVSVHETPTSEDMLRRIKGGRVLFWLDDDGDRVHLTAANSPSFGAARISPVYTPSHARRRGYASAAAVAEVSRLIVEGGARARLFTDQANPTSNRIYQAPGYQPVVDMANLLVT